MDKPVATGQRLVKLKLVTIIAEALLEQQIIALVLRCGAKGYSIGMVTGEGSRNVRVGDIAGPNIHLETLVSEEVAENILVRLSSDYFPKYALIAFSTDAAVIRGDKYI